MPQPDLDGFFDQLCSRYAWDFGALSGNLGIASGIVVGTNPPYGPADFLAFYPKFAGSTPPVKMQGTLTAGSAVVAVADSSGLTVGQLVGGSGIAPGSLIQSVDSATQITLSLSALSTTVSGSAALTIYDTVFPLAPLPVINAYIALASASLAYARWQDMWTIGMGLFVAHYLTLWVRSDGDIYSTPGQAAAAGLARGITVSKGAGPVSMGVQPVTGLEGWASWNETTYGLQFASMAKVVGMGPILVW